MNLLGAIGTLMKGTGLEDILGSVYGENTLAHIMTGKSVQRAFRAHILVYKYINRMVVAEIVKKDPEFAAMIEESEKMYLSLLHGKETLETVQASYLVSKVNMRLEKKKLELCTRTKTSQLWINYQLKHVKSCEILNQC
jgi:hypothetical protein